MSWFDAGVNLLDRRFNAQDVILRAQDAGVSRLCIITTHPNEWERAATLHSQFPDVCCYTIGVHPHNAKDVVESDYQRLCEFASLPGAVAVGECGLDFNRNFSPPEIQIAVFEAQLDIANQLQRPVYLHERDAFNQQMACLHKVKDSLAGGVAHCFTGGNIELKAYLALGLYIGITGWACDENKGQLLRTAVPNIPLDRIVLETDAPYLFPKTLRPRKRNNEPAYLPHIAEDISELMQVSPAILRQNSYANSCRLFSVQ